MNKFKDYFDALVETLLQQDGSDIHLTAGLAPALRINGELVFLEGHQKLLKEDIDGILAAVLTEKNLATFTFHHDLDFSYQYKESTRLRGNAFVSQSIPGATFRLIPQVKTVAELNLPSILSEFARKRQGFFLVVGPVGQGKSATMAAMVDVINSEKASHILTIEDPIEYAFAQKKSIITQREVGLDVESFEIGLKGALREDVNTILIGEMRNTETIGAAVTAAETGHLVLSTLHTNNASQTIDRIIDSFPAGKQDQIRTQLAGSLLGIFSQRLIPRMSGGRVPAYELLINNTAVANLIREKRTHEIDSVIETSAELGMIDMNRSLIELVRQGQITVKDAFMYSNNPKNLERML
ncbi:MAG: PilT/PilU family type 4a pilus ATPase [bacterium]